MKNIFQLVTQCLVNWANNERAIAIFRKAYQKKWQ